MVIWKCLLPLCLLFMAMATGCEATSSASSAGAATDAAAETAPPFLVQTVVAGGWGPVGEKVVRFTHRNGVYRIERTVIDVGADGAADRDAAAVAATYGAGLQSELLDLDILTMSDAPSLDVTDNYTYRYTVVAGGRGNFFSAYAVSDQDDERYGRIAVLLNRCAQRFVDVPRYAARLSRSGGRERRDLFDELEREIQPAALYGSFPAEAYLNEEVMHSERWDPDRFIVIGSRIGPSLVQPALEMLRNGSPKRRELLYLLLQRILEQEPETPKWHEETAWWARENPDLARRTADEIRRALADGELRSMLTQDLYENRGSTVGGRSACSGQLLLTLGDTASIDAVLNAAAINAQRKPISLQLAPAFTVGGLTVGNALLHRLSDATEPSVRSELARNFYKWSRFASPATLDASPDRDRFVSQVVAQFQPQLAAESAGKRSNAALFLQFYASAVDVEKVETSLLIERPQSDEDPEQFAVTRKIRLLQAIGSAGEEVLRSYLDHPVLGDRIVVALANTKEPALMSRLCAIARNPGWIKRRYIVHRFDDTNDPRTIATLIWMLGQDDYEQPSNSFHGYIANILTSITKLWNQVPDEDDPQVHIWWRNWWKAHHDEYPPQYGPPIGPMDNDDGKIDDQ